MNILYDHQIFSIQTYGGISRYFAELIKGINDDTTNQAALSLLYTNNTYVHDLNLAKRFFFKDVSFPKKMPLLYNINKSKSCYDIVTKTNDVIHSTYYDPYLLPLLKGRPFVITFLDMIHEKFGHQFSRELVYDGTITKQKKLLATRADQIIAISESTKRDIVELLDVDPGKIKVIYLGNSLSPNSNPSSINLVDHPYFLFVGNRGTYKNFDGLLNAIHPLLKATGIKLVCAGGGTFTLTEKELIHSVKANNNVIHIPFTDQTLRSLYQNAIAFIFPSLYEGFGIPILEAFSCDCPCILSDVSSLPEIAGDAALYIDPALPESILQATKLILSDSELRLSLIQKGKKRLESFSWQKTVADTLNVYKLLK